MTFLHTDHRVA